jgi:PKHD-type hydroxylase
MNDTLVERTWVWNNFLSPENCEAVIEDYFKPDTSEIAAIGPNGNHHVMLDYRKTEICWIPKTEAISLLMFSKSLIANTKAGWGFDIDDHEPTQIAKYEEGGHYDWHTDETFFDRKRGYHRKVSSIIFLSDPSTYVGGDLIFESPLGEHKIDVGIGSIICFPSETRHKVKPVTEGIRYSLASWAIGPLMR